MRRGCCRHEPGARDAACVALALPQEQPYDPNASMPSPRNTGRHFKDHTWDRDRKNMSIDTWPYRWRALENEDWGWRLAGRMGCVRPDCPRLFLSTICIFTKPLTQLLSRSLDCKSGRCAPLGDDRMHSGKTDWMNRSSQGPKGNTYLAHWAFLLSLHFRKSLGTTLFFVGTTHVTVSPCKHWPDLSL